MSLRSRGGEGRILGRYALHDEIASGGMASVYFGRMTGAVGFARVVAIKRLHPHLAKDPDFVSMIIDEARLAARIVHPNVVPTLDVVAEGDEVFIVMEYVQGESLARLQYAQAQLGERAPIRTAITLITGVLHGLHAAHEAKSELGEPLGIVHRDVSPQNVLVGADGTVRVIDFGVAKAAGKLHSTREGSVKGKVAYMAPEQIRGEQVTRRSDVYAAGVLLWELLAGQRLFSAENDVVLVHRITSPSFTPEPPSAYNPDVPPELDALVLTALAADPAARFATAREMAQHLEQAGAIASASSIGDWVERLAASTLQARAAIVANVEKMPSPSGSISALTGPISVPGLPAPVTSSSETPSAHLITAQHDVPARKKPPVAQIVGAVLLVAVAAGALVLLRGTNATVAAPSATFGKSPGQEGRVAPFDTSHADPVAAHDDAPLPKDDPPPPRASHPSSKHHAPPPAEKPDCDPPYDIDAQGHKIYKRRCLK